jgi:hypothetical protein
MPTIQTDHNQKEKSKAATKIAQWWRKIRSSGKVISFNPNGNHSAPFHLFLNHKTDVPKQLTYHQDEALLKVIQSGDWKSERFKTDAVYASLTNLFASGKITWEQHATCCDIVETQRVYGKSIAYPILTAEGEFTKKAKKYLLPFLKKNVVAPHLSEFSHDEITHFKKLISALPLSERFFFVFPEQKFDRGGSSPSRQSELRSTFIAMADAMQVIRALKRTMNILFYLSSTMQYQGILKLSFGAENALGLTEHGPNNWWKMVPRVGKQTIDDIDDLSKDHVRPTRSPISRQLGIEQESEMIHSAMEEYPEIVAHDDYHRKTIALLGENVHQGVERIINIARTTFGFKWSKDIWLLRDFDLTSASLFARMSLSALTLDKQQYTSRLFGAALNSVYIPNQLENCTPAVQSALDGKAIMLDPQGNPNQIALAFVIDLVRNPKEWEAIHIVANEIENDKYAHLISMAKNLNELGIFTDDMKANVIKFDHFVKSRASVDLMLKDWGDTEVQNTVKLHFLPFHEKELKRYCAKRNNKEVFLGFVKEANSAHMYSLRPKIKP